MEQVGYSSTSRVHAAIRRARDHEHSSTSLERKIDQQANLDLALRRQVAILSTAPPPGASAEIQLEYFDRWTRAAQAVVRISERSSRLWGDDAPSRRVVDVHVITDEALAAEREETFAELVAMGVDPSVLPTVEETYAKLQAQVVDTTAVDC